jgi:hypothetical protein
MILPCSSSGHVATRQIIPLDGSTATATLTATIVAGGSGGDWVPQSAVLVKHQTAHRGRSGRGRTYLPLIGEMNISAGIFDPGVISTVQPAWDTFLSTMNTANWSPVVAHYDRAHSGVGAAAYPILRYVVEGFTATQRRRQPGRKVTRHRRHVIIA